MRSNNSDYKDMMNLSNLLSGGVPAQSPGLQALARRVAPLAAKRAISAGSTPGKRSQIIKKKQRSQTIESHKTKQLLIF